MSKKQVKISKLCLEIGGKKIELTMKQAKELNEVLNDTFGGSEVIFRDRWHWLDPHWTPPYYTSTCGTITTSSDDISVYNSSTTDTANLSASEWQGQIDAGMITLTAQ